MTPSVTSTLPRSIAGFVPPNLPENANLPKDANLDDVSMTYNFVKNASGTEVPQNGDEEEANRALDIWECATGATGLISSLHPGFQMSEAEKDKRYKSMCGALGENTGDLTGCWVERSVEGGTQGTLYVKNDEGQQGQTGFIFGDRSPVDALHRVRESVPSRAETIEPSMGA
jgi:hypothetical protein